MYRPKLTTQKKLYYVTRALVIKWSLWAVVAWGQVGGGAMLPPSIRVGRLYPPHYYICTILSPGFSDLLMALLMVIINRNKIVV